MRHVFRWLMFMALLGPAAVSAQCDVNGVLLELQATTNLNGLLIGGSSCISTATVSSPLVYSSGVLSITAGGYAIKRDSSLTGWGTTANPLGIKGYAGASNGQVPSKSTGGITWITPSGITDLTFSGSSSPVTLNSSSGTDVTITAGTGISFSATSGNITITPTDQSATNEIQRLDTFTIVSNILRASLLNDGVPFSSVDLSPYLGTGTVTSVAITVPSILSVSGSPITSSGTFAVTLATQSANTVFAGPTSGGAATPTFRALVAADIPAGTNLWTDAGATTYLTATGDNVAIGGTSASQKLDVTGNIQGSQDLYLGSAFKIYDGGGLYLHKTGTRNLFIGVGSGNLTTTGSDNYAIGRNTMAGCTSCGANFAAGDQSLKAITTGGSNVGLGTDAGLSLTTGSNNMFIGRSSGSTVTTGSGNVGVGYLAIGTGITTQDNNTALGFLSLYGQAADNCVSIGAESGEGSTTRTQAVYIGAFAGYGSTAATQISLGFHAGRNNSTNSVNIGYAAGFQNTGNDQFTIDWNSGFTTNKAPLIAGNFSSKYVGINTGHSALASVLQVTGTGTTSGTYDLIVTNSGGTTSTATIVARSDGVVGIGTNAPSQKLHVVGSVRVTGAFYDSANSAGSNGYVLTSASTGTATAWIASSSVGLACNATCIYSCDGAIKTSGASVDMTAGALRLVLPATGSPKGLDVVGNSANTANRYITMRTASDSVRFQETGGQTYLQHLGGGNFNISSANIIDFSGDSLHMTEGIIQTVVSMPYILGTSDGAHVKRMEGIDDQDILQWQDTTGQWEAKPLGWGKYFLSGAATQTLQGAHFVHRADANSNAVTLNMGTGMIEWRDYIIECSRNNTNAITFTGTGGCSIKWDTDGTVGGDPSVAVGAGGAGFQGNFKVYFARRVGSIIYIK